MLPQANITSHHKYIPAVTIYEYSYQTLLPDGIRKGKEDHN